MAATSDRNRLAITAIEAISPLGGNAQQTAAAIKAGISAFGEYPLLGCMPKDPDREAPLPMYVAAVPSVDPACAGGDRLIQLAMPPLEALLGSSKLNRAALARTGLLLALPQQDAATVELGLDAGLAIRLCKRMGLNLKTCNASPRGRAGVFVLLEQAKALLESGELDFCIVGGVDSYLTPARLGLLDSQWRVKSERNVDGFIPGEAAAMLLIEKEAHALGRGIEPLAIIEGFGAGRETELLGSAKASSGAGLTTAIRAALEPEGEAASPDHAYCDFNGESYFAFELGLVMTRLAAAFTKDVQVRHPADCHGDVGAASGAMLCACAIAEFQSAGDPAGSVLLWTSADDGTRSALRMARPASANT